MDIQYSCILLHLHLANNAARDNVNVVQNEEPVCSVGQGWAGAAEEGGTRHREVQQDARGRTNTWLTRREGSFIIQNKNEISDFNVKKKYVNLFLQGYIFCKNYGGGEGDGCGKNKKGERLKVKNDLKRLKNDL